MTSFNFSLFFLLSLLINPLAIGSENFDCKESLKEIEGRVVRLVTLNGKKIFKEFYIGSYEKPSNKTHCNHNIILTYNSSWDSQNPQIIFRYFNMDEMGRYFKPPVFMHGRLFYEKENQLGNKNTIKVSQSYKCERRLEWEEDLLRWRNYKNPWISSLVFPQKNYPFCDYHIFMTNAFKDFEVIDQKIWVTHFNLDETGDFKWIYPRDVTMRRIDFNPR